MTETQRVPSDAGFALAGQLCAELKMLGSPTRGEHLGAKQSGTIIWDLDGWPAVKVAIARALDSAERNGATAEREVCALIADQYDQSPGDDTPMGPVMVGQVQIAQSISATIRARGSEAWAKRIAGIDVDYEATKTVSAMVERVKAAGLTDEAAMFETIYWAWLRTVSAYVAAHPYVAQPDGPTMTPISALHITDCTLKHWGPQIPGTPKIDDAAVIEEAAADEEWHRQEDRRMRRAAGEEI